MNKIFFKKYVELKTTTKTIIYFLEARDRDLINKIFDDLHSKDRFQWTKKNIFWNYFCFVVWKVDSNEVEKRRMIVNMKRLNDLTISNVYFLFLQFGIIVVVWNCSYISIINCAKFFYQWRIHLFNRHKLTIINHRDQKSFNVIVMKYWNSSFYLQKQIDRFLQNCHAFVKAYINDVIVFFQIEKKISCSFKKNFSNFPKTQHFHQIVQDFFNLFVDTTFKTKNHVVKFDHERKQIACHKKSEIFNHFASIRTLFEIDEMTLRIR